ncbi:MAG TPA: GNAT family N-acetyltransferase [Clostridiaceae bacterium]|nr:GNAT family N-acetyltransferase [Clostridiaceae bacterium]HHV99074.1 GNAT family N-acetyltransferase [Clostridiaceae bacterium]
MLDKSIQFYRVLMKRDKGTPLVESRLPDSFAFSLFKSGDEKDWAEIETSVGEFDRAVDALVYFQKNYLPYLSELERRCIFIEDDKGKKIGTLTIWWNYTGVRRDPWIHWVAVRPEYQGLGLGKALVFEGLRRLIEIEGDRDVYLATQTWSYKAINIYIKSGFKITDERGLAGFENNEYDKAIELLKNYIKL